MSEFKVGDFVVIESGYSRWYAEVNAGFVALFKDGDGAVVTDVQGEAILVRGARGDSYMKPEWIKVDWRKDSSDANAASDVTGEDGRRDE
jgi:hypothetical protein